MLIKPPSQRLKIYECVIVYMSQKPVIAITGSTGFIGSYLVKMFHGNGYHVVAMSSHLREKIETGIVNRRFDLAASPDQIDLSGCDILIHCAYAKKKTDKKVEDLNIKGSQNLFEVADRMNVSKVIFLSSLSAREDAISSYGRSKFLIEQMLNLQSDLVVRPGLVLGQEGLFGNIFRSIQRAWFVPLVDGGRQELQGIDVEDLGRCLLFAVEQNVSGSYNLVADELFTLRELARTIMLVMGKNIPFVSIPYWIVNFGLTMVEILHIPFLVNRENLLGLKQNKIWDTGSCLHIFGVQPRSYIESIKRLTT